MPLGPLVGAGSGPVTLGDRGIIHLFRHRRAAIYARILPASRPDDASLRRASMFGFLIAGLISLQLISLICAATKV